MKNLWKINIDITHSLHFTCDVNDYCKRSRRKQKWVITRSGGGLSNSIVLGSLA